MRGQKRERTCDGFPVSRLIMSLVILVMFASMWSSTGANGTTWVVDDNLGEWADFTNIQDAIDNSTDGDTIAIYNGSYREFITINQTINMIGNGTHSNETVLKWPYGFKSWTNLISVYAPNVTIKGLSIYHHNKSHSEWAIWISADNCTIRNLNFTGNSGIRVENGYGTNVKNITFNHCYFGLYLIESNMSAVEGIVSGQNSSYWRGKEHNWRTNFPIGSFRSNNVSIGNCTLINPDDGIAAYESMSLRIVENNISCPDEYGIMLREGSDFGLMIGNIISGNRSGHKIYVRESSDIRIQDNHIFKGPGPLDTISWFADGIYIWESNRTEIVSNRVSGNSGDGIVAGGSSTLKIIGNRIFDNGRFDDGTGLVIMVDNSKITYNNISGNHGDGISVRGNDNRFAYNDISGYVVYGLDFSDSTGNVIHNNNIYRGNSSVGTAVDSWGNTNLSNQQWDDGREGNYWYDYTGTDMDGNEIGDTPYPILGKANATDRYPLMEANGSRKIYTWIVDDDNGSWADFKSIQAAINASSNWDVVRVFDGVYCENLTIDRDISVIGNGTETILNGSDRWTRLVKIYSNVTMCGFRLHDTYATQLGHQSYGISIIDDSPLQVVIKDCLLHDLRGGITHMEGELNPLSEIYLTNITVQNCLWHGIHFSELHRFECNGLTIVNTSTGIELNRASVGVLSNISIQSSRRDGWEIDDCTDITIRNCTIIGEQNSIRFGFDIRDSDNITLTDLNISHWKIGIQIRDSDQILIEKSIFDCEKGISGSDLEHITILDSYFNGSYGVLIDYSEMVEIRNLSSIAGNPIDIDKSDEVKIKEIEIWNSSIGISLGWDRNVTIENVTMNNMNSSGVYCHSVNNVVINSLSTNNCSMGIFFVISENITVHHSVINDCYAGISLDESSHVSIYNNEISGNKWGGIYTKWSRSSYNITITENILRDNRVGVNITSLSTKYSIYQNQFYNNSEHSGNSQGNDDANNGKWDDGYEGNYWSDYKGIDLNNDGIGDKPYIIDGQGNAIDRYPLMEPNGSRSNTIWTVDDDNGSWADFDDLQDAVDMSAPGDIIRVYAGNYSGLSYNYIEHSMDLIGNGSDQTNLSGTFPIGVEEFVERIHISGFTIMGSYGLDIRNAYDVSIENCTFRDPVHRFRGLDTSENMSLSISNCQFYGCGIEMEDLSLEIVETWEIVNCTVNDDPIIFIKNGSDLNITDSGQTILLNCSNVMIHDDSYEDVPGGIIMFNCSNVEIWNLNISGDFGIIGRGLYKISVHNSSFDGHCGVYIIESELVTIRDISTWTGWGVYLQFTTNVKIEEIETTHGSYGIILSAVSNGLIDRAMVHNHSVIGLFSLESEDITIRSSSFEATDDQIRLLGGTGISIEDCSIWAGEKGVLMESCTDILIENCIINYSDRAGIEMFGAPGEPVENIEIIGNDIQNCGVGIIVGKMTTNYSIHHNQFYDNFNLTSQAYDEDGNETWDDGMEGNYWSDYNGTDANDDGIGDIPYQLEGAALARDRYPLMSPNSSSSSHTDNELDIETKIDYEGDLVDGESITVTIHLGSHSGLPHESNITLRFRVNLDGEEVEERSFNISISPGYSNGTVTQNVTLNGSGNFTFESEITHNNLTIDSSSTTITSDTRDYTFSLVMDRSTTSADPGDDIEYRLTIENLGNVPQSFELSSSMRWIDISNTTIYLLPDEELSTNVSASIPSNASGTINFTILVESVSGDDVVNSGEASVTITVGEEDVDPERIAWVFVGASFGLLIGGFAGIWSIDRGKWLLIPLVSPLYSKLKRETIPDHEIRGKIVVYLDSVPGAHFNKIKQELGLKNGSAGYHLRVLEKGGFIKSVSDGMYRRFYPHGYSIPNVHLGNMEKKIVMEIIKKPGISQKDLSNKLKISPSTITYHIKDLKEKGIVTYSRRTGCLLTDEYHTILKDQKDKP